MSYPKANSAKTIQAEAFANAKLKEFGLADEGWTFRFDRGRRRMGLCNFNLKIIQLSRALCEINDEAEWKDTILHEIAHALRGFTRVNGGHDKEWMEWCEIVGARPQRYYDNKKVVAVTPRWIVEDRTNGRVWIKYNSKPKARDWSNVWIKGKKAQTRGKLQLVAFCPQRHGHQLEG